MRYRLSPEQGELLAGKFGTYRTHNWGRLLENEAFLWIEQQENLDASISWGDAHVGTTVTFASKPVFTDEQVKFLQSR